MSKKRLTDLTGKITHWGVVRFFTKSVIGFLMVGLVLIILGETKFFSTNWPAFFSGRLAFIDALTESVGSAVLGGGVFSALIQSTRFLRIYKSVFEEVIWSKEFLRRRGDIRTIWSNVSRLLYEEKFPALSSQIEDIITTEYFPTTHDFYLENYDFTLNIRNIDDDYTGNILKQLMLL